MASPPLKAILGGTNAGSSSILRGDLLRPHSLRLQRWWRRRGQQRPTASLYSYIILADIGAA
jgi:hypothetical protein